MLSTASQGDHGQEYAHRPQVSGTCVQADILHPVFNPERDDTHPRGTCSPESPTFLLGLTQNTAGYRWSTWGEQRDNEAHQQGIVLWKIWNCPLILAVTSSVVKWYTVISLQVGCFPHLTTVLQMQTEAKTLCHSCRLPVIRVPFLLC